MRTPEEKDVQDQEAETKDAADADRGEGSAGPAEDLETDPAYEPDDENMKGIKGG